DVAGADGCGGVDMSGAGPGGPALWCAVRRTSLISLVDVTGVLRLDTVPRLREAVLKAVAEDPEAIVLDLTGVEAVEDELSLVVFSTLGRLVTDRLGSELLLAAPDIRLRVALQRAAPLFVQVFATHAEAWFAAEHGASGRRVGVQLPATRHAPRLARHLVDEMCARWKLRDELRQRAQVVVTELVTNAVKYVGGHLELVITVRRYVLRLEVSDHSTVLPHPREASPAATGGRGLPLVSRLVDNWGIRPTTGGKTIWADLVLSPSARK
ncbi:MAG: ATP-binding protein, partial [Pseudonocardiaceae bacterium]